jgi:hypothetical protein
MVMKLRAGFGNTFNELASLDISTALSVRGINTVSIRPLPM